MASYATVTPPRHVLRPGRRIVPPGTVHAATGVPGGLVHRNDGRAGLGRPSSWSYRRACRCGFSGSGCSTSRGGSPSGLGVGRMSGVRGVWERHHIRCRGQGTEIDWTHASGACAQPARTLGQRSSQRTSLWCAMPISRPPRVLVRSRFPRVPRPPPTTRCRHRTRQLLRPR
jgi:hypothetical protein